MTADAFEDIPNAGSDLRWWQNKGTLKLNLLLCAIYAAQALNGFDGALVSGFQAFPSWKKALGYPSASDIGLLNAGFYLAGLVIAPVTAYVADKYGRRICVAYSALANLIGTVIGACSSVGGSDGYGMFMASRVICGSGFGCALMACPILLHELPHPRHRTKMAGFFDCSYNIGAFMSAWTIFGCSYISNNWSWRIPYLMHIPFAFVMLGMIWFIPESPRWLMSKGRTEQAIAFMTKYHAMGVKDDPLVLFQVREIQESLELEGTTAQASWGSLIKNRGNRRRVACIVVMAMAANLSGSSVMQYYYTGILKLVGLTDQSQVTAIGAGKTTFTFFVGIAGLIATQYIPRRRQLAISWGGLLVANICLIVTCAMYAKSPSTDRNLAAGKAAVVFVWFYSAFNDFSAGPIYYVYPAEVMHYTIRARGQMIWTVVSKCLSIFNAYANSVALAAIGWKYFFVYTGLIVIISALIYFIIVETKGLTLEEISEAFDGPAINAMAMESALPSVGNSSKEDVRIGVNGVDEEKALH
ncbi:hypothetical protein IAT38_000736 [Cryptococcus sp. DSM 104549]